MSTGNRYPFVSKAQLLARISSEPSFALECVRMIEAHRGWMVSHRIAASKLVSKIASGALDDDDNAEAVRLASRYGKTLARLHRERDLAERPELASVAALYSVLPSVAAPSPNEASSHATLEERSEASAPCKGDDVEVSPRRRGRPKGSKNKPKPAREDGRRRGAR